MRKLFCTGLMLGALSLVFGSAPAANAFGGPGCNYTYMCTCSGQALKCCGTVCQPTTEIGCTQGYNC